VVLAPFGPLHLLPLGAARNPITQCYAVDEYRLSLAPSLVALHIIEQETHRRHHGNKQTTATHLLNVAYPGIPDSENYLPSVMSEAGVVARCFTHVTPLYEDAATPDAVIQHARDQHVIHFGCHGDFDAKAPTESGLMLAGSWLTVQRIITELNLSNVNLVTIGACLSGRIQVRRGEEHVGLLQALMTAGARSVIASLWSVDDVATRVLFETFYAAIEAGHPPVIALANATRRVREQPEWSHPYYWAAFHLSGLPYTKPILDTAGDLRQ